MNIILFTNQRGRAASIPLNRPQIYLPLMALFLGLSVALFYLGYRTAAAGGEVLVTMAPKTSPWTETLEDQRRQIDSAREQADAHLNALALRLGQLQAQMLRVDALGERLTKMADLDAAEFDFGQLPAQGGPAPATELPDTELPDFLEALEALSRQLEDRQRKLAVLEKLVMHENLKDQVVPAGRPIRKGWISSRFGKRTDPFTGKPAHHHGMDFAGKAGSEVVAVAAGVVTWSGKRSGYGQMVEIDHGNGYLTRYGHNQENLVQVGEKVRKGQTIARMGSSGRSTGPHVHFEVSRNGRTVDPVKYIAAAR